MEDWAREDYVKLFEIVKLRGTDPKTGMRKWKGVGKAAEAFNVTRPTIYDALDHAMEQWGGAPPEKAKLVMPKVALQFFESDGWLRVKGHKYEKEIRPVMMKAWEVLGRYDPISWTPLMIANLKKQFIEGKPNPLYIGITNNISPESATQLRRAIGAMGRYGLDKEGRPLPRIELKDELLAELEDIPKRPAGSRQSWYLENAEIKQLIQAIEDLDVLIYTRIGLECGARPISLAGVYSDKKLMLTTDKVDEGKHSIKRWESKKVKWATPKFADSTIEMVKRYIKDMNLPYGAKLLPKNEKYYSDKIKEAGLQAGINKFEPEGAAGYILRHTFATQAMENDMSLETVMYMGAWKDAATLLAYYVEIKESKLDREVRGEEKEQALDFADWVAKFDDYWNQAYEKCLANFRQPKPQPEAKPKKEPEKPRKKVPFSWERIEAITKASAKTEKGKRLIEHWKKVYAFHLQHPRLTYAEIKERLKK